MSHPIQQVTDKIAQGEVPSNKEIHSAIDTAEQVLEDSKNQTNLNVHGERLVHDAQEILESAKKFIEEKNEGDKLQKLVQHGKEATEKLGDLSSNVNLNPVTPDVNKEAMATFNSAKKLAYFALNSSEFKNTLLDLVNLMQDILKVARESLGQAPKALQQDITSGSGTNIPRTTQTVQRAVNEIENIASARSPKLDELDRRLANLINKMYSRSEFKEAKDHFFVLFDKLANQLKSVEESTTKVATQAVESNEVAKLWDDLKDLTEGFTGKESLGHLETQIRYLMDEFKLNPKASETFNRMRDFINDIWEHPRKLEESSQEIKDLIDQTVDLLRADTIQIKFSNFLDVGNNMLKSIKHDTSSQDLLEKLLRFSKDFALDSQNRPSPYIIQDSLIQLKNILLPIIKQHVVAFKIPYIHHSDETYDLDVGGLDVHFEDILPHQIEIKGKNFVGLDVSELKFTEAHGLVIMKLTELKAKFSDVNFKYHRKAIPRTQDEGLADIDLSQGKGIYIKISWKITSSKDGIVGVSLDSVKCDIDKLKLRIKHSKHNLLENFAASLFSGWVQQRAAEAIVNTIIDTIQPYNESMNDFFRQVSLQQFAENANQQLKGVYEHGLPIPTVGQVVEQAKSTYESAKQKVSETVEKASSTLEEVKRPIVSAAEQAKEFVQENLPEVAEKFSEGKQEAQSFFETEEPSTQFFEEYVSPTSFTSEVSTQSVIPESTESGNLPSWYSSFSAASTALSNTELLEPTLLDRQETAELEDVALEPEITTIPPEPTSPSEKSFAELLAQEAVNSPLSILLEPEFPLPPPELQQSTTIEEEEKDKEEKEEIEESFFPEIREAPATIPAGIPELVFEPEHSGSYEVKESTPITIDTTVRVDIKEWDGSVQLPVSKVEEPSFIPPQEIATLPREKEEEPKFSK